MSNHRGYVQKYRVSVMCCSRKIRRIGAHPFLVGWGIVGSGESRTWQACASREE